MAIRVYNPGLVWHPHPNARVQSAVERVLGEWEGTPYESGQRARGLGADCVGSVFGVVDDLDGQGRAEYPGLPRDAAMHSRETAVRAIRELVRRYSPCRKVERGEDGLWHVRPGNIVVTNQGSGGPGHVMMVGGPNQLWHALEEAGFHNGGWTMLRSVRLYAIYQIEDDERWT